MRLDPKAELFGQPPLKLRNALRELPSGDSSARPIPWRRHLPDLTEAEQQALEKRLLEEGLVQCPFRERWPERMPFFSLTDKGLRLANASGRSYLRKTAEKALKELLQRAEAINQGDYAYTVTLLIVFGSYLTGAERLGDLDVAFDLKRRYVPDPNLTPGSREAMEDFEKWVWQYRSRAPRGSSWMTAMFWPSDEIHRKLKNRSHIISLTPLEGHEEMLAEVPHRVVLGVWEPPVGVGD